MASGLSAILGAASFVGALLVILGIGLAVVASSQGKGTRGGAILAILGVFLFFAFQLISRGVIVVQPTQVAVVFRTLSGELITPREAGTHVIVPVFEEAILYPINIQEYTMSGRSAEGQLSGDDGVRARTQDGQVVLMDVTVFYRVEPTTVNDLHVRWYETTVGRANYENEFVRPTVRALVRDVVSKFTAREIYGETRTEMREEMARVVRERFAGESLSLTDLLLRDVTFSDQFTAAIEQAQVAEQEALRAQIRVQQISQEADQRRVRAAGERDAAIAGAEGEAQSIILRAQAEAEALRLVSEQVAANPGLIQYLYVQNLSDNVSIALVPSNSPFLFDFNSLPQADPNFVAPESDFNADTFQDTFGNPEVPDMQAIPQAGDVVPTPVPEGES